jgi:hypothetical protein
MAECRVPAVARHYLEEPMMKSRLTFVALLTLAAFTVHAQDFYYQSMMPDGRIVVGDKPAPGAKDVRKIPVRKGNVADPVINPTPPSTAAGATSGAPPSLNTADAELNQAREQLQAAKAALEAGTEPQAGERTGTAGGGSRLNDAYDKRIKGLQDAVNVAQKRFDEALSKRNSFR